MEGPVDYLEQAGPVLDTGTRQGGEDQTGQPAAAGRADVPGCRRGAAVAVVDRDGAPAVEVRGRPDDRRVPVQLDDEITHRAQAGDEAGGVAGGDAVPARHGAAGRVGTLAAGRWEENGHRDRRKAGHGGRGVGLRHWRVGHVRWLNADTWR
jgi:hypothetical protein